jgi:SAM-dependent methyltransferase
MAIPLVEVDQCPACGYESSKLDRIVKGYRLDKCSVCGFVYANPRPDESKMFEYYSLEQKLVIDRSEAPSSYHQVFYTEVLKELSDLLKNQTFKKDVRLLDFGCGDGAFLRLCAQTGWECYGIEIGQAAQIAERRSGCVVYDGKICELDIEPESFDVVFSSAVLEHLLSPGEDLSCLYRLLKPGGLFFSVSVPNHNYIMVRLGINDIVSFPPPGHVNFFTPKSLKKLAITTGFSEARVTTYGLDLWPILRRVAPQRKDRDDNSSNASESTRSIAKRAIDRLLSLGAELYYRIPLFTWGCSLKLLAIK